MPNAKNAHYVDYAALTPLAQTGSCPIVNCCQQSFRQKKMYPTASVILSVHKNIYIFKCTNSYHLKLIAVDD